MWGGGGYFVNTFKQLFVLDDSTVLCSDNLLITNERK